MDWLVKLRNNMNMTQAEVAEKAKMPRTTYTSIEQGRRNPSVKNAMRIASVLQFDWTIFFKDELRDSSHISSVEKQEVIS